MTKWSHHSTQNYAIRKNLVKESKASFVSVKLVQGSRLLFESEYSLKPLNSTLVKLEGTESLNRFVKESAPSTQKTKIVFSYKQKNRSCEASYPVLQD